MKNEKLVMVIGKDQETTKKFQKILEASDLKADTVEANGKLPEKLSPAEYDLVLLEADAFGTGLSGAVKKLKDLAPLVPTAVYYSLMDEQSLISGYEHGVDDFIPASSSPNLLAPELKAMIRLSKSREALRKQIIVVGPFSYNCSTLQLYKNGVEIILTAKENAIVKLFLDNEGAFLSKATIYRLIWGSDVPNDNAVTVYINRIRSKIEDHPKKPKYLRTTRRQGYCFSIPK